MIDKSSYNILGVNPSMSLSDIRSKYSKLAKMYHPDGTNGNPSKFKEICDAWNSIKKDYSKPKGRLHNKGSLTHITLFNIRREL